MSTFSWTDTDLLQLESRGISTAEAERQLRLLRNGGDAANLDRPCIPGDGILQLDGDRLAEIAALQQAASKSGRFERFVPASGAATRMFKSLIHFHSGPGKELTWEQIEAAAEGGENLALEMTQALREADRLPFHSILESCLEAEGGLTATIKSRNHKALLRAVFDEDALNGAAQPKGLLPFHSYPDGARTPVEEHLTEAASYAAAESGRCRVHFTVSAEHQGAFEALLDERRPALESALDRTFEITMSNQHASTDTLAAELDGSPARDDSGQLQFRPGGHGSLLENLSQLSAEFVYVKNIDNVQPEWRRSATLEWKTVLGGLAVELQEEAHDLVHRLRGATADSVALEAGSRFCCDRLGLQDPASETTSGDRLQAALLAQIDRPLRVCGVVPNTGEPGGGPFWVRGREPYPTPQIVESAQIDLERVDQLEIFNQATHFNPVDLVCCLRDADGAVYPLDRYVDPNAVIVTSKFVDGRELLVLERPGLWNGAMACWNTVFVEVPLATFSPVKSVLDLLRPEHQPA